MQYMIDKIDNASNGREIDIKHFVGPSVSNVIMLMTIGQRYDFDHPIRQNVDKIFLAGYNRAALINFFNIQSHFPDVMRFVISITPTFLIPNLKRFATFMPDLLNKATEERIQVVEQMSEYELNEAGDTFLDSYLKYMKLIQNSENETSRYEKQFFTPDNGRACAQAFLAAGSGTTKDAIEWALGVLAAHQDVQDEVHREIIKVAGARAVSIKDKNNMPTTESMLLEVLRFSSQIPINLPHW